MREIVAMLETGIVLTTPIFFLVTLLVLWRILRSLDTTMAVAIHLKRQIEVVGRGGLAAGVRATDEVRDVERKQYQEEPGENDEDHSG